MNAQVIATLPTLSRVEQFDICAGVISGRLTAPAALLRQAVREGYTVLYFAVLPAPAGDVSTSVFPTCG